MFRGMTEIHNKIQAIVTNALEQLNIDVSINSILPGGRKPDLVIENKNYIVNIAAVFDCQENKSKANYRKIENYLYLRFVIPYRFTWFLVK